MYYTNMVPGVQWLYRCTEPSTNGNCTHQEPHMTAQVYIQPLYILYCTVQLEQFYHLPRLLARLRVKNSWENEADMT